MPFQYLACPACGAKVKEYRNPLPTVDIIIELPEGCRIDAVPARKQLEMRIAKG